MRLMQEEAALYEDPGSQFQSYKLDKNNPEELEANQLKMQEDLEKQQRKNELLKELEEAEAMVEEEAWTPTPTPWQNEDESEQVASLGHLVSPEYCVVSFVGKTALLTPNCLLIVSLTSTILVLSCCMFRAHSDSF